jgi:hypothetical protein
MRESRTYGVVRGALSNERPYRNHHGRSQGAQRNEPHRGSHKSRKNGLGIVAEI